MPTLRQFGSKAQHAATAFGQLIQRLLRRCLLLISPLYPVLKWIASVAFVSLVIDLLAAYMAGGLNLSRLKAATEFMAAHRTPALLVVGASIVLFFAARVGYVWREMEERLRLAFRISRPAQELSLADFGFRASHPHEQDR